MNFKQAYEALKQGKDIKRPSWKGFWRKENGTIAMHCKDGRVIPITDSENIFYTLNNIATDDWEIIDGSTITGLNISTFTFGEAISRIKRGQKVARKGWNGKAQFIELASNISYCRRGDIINCEHKSIGNQAIAFVGNSGVQIGWLASQADMLSDDWFEVDYEVGSALPKRWYDNSEDAEWESYLTPEEKTPLMERNDVL